MSSTWTVGSIVALCQKKLLDESEVDWSSTELITLYNMTNRKIVTLVPRAYTRITTMQMASGNKQIIPQAGLAVIDVIRNMGTDGATPGRIVRQTNMYLMNSYVPTYSTDTANADSSVWDWWPVELYPEQFYVHPQSDGNGYVEIEMAQTPADVVYDAGGVWQSTTMAVSDLYLDAVINGIMFQAYDDDTDIPGNTPRSAMYYARFLQALGIQTGGQAQ